MRSNPLRIGLILGSTRQGRFCDVVTAWVQRELARREDLRLSVIDPRVLGGGGDADSGFAAVRSGIAEADGFVVVTPEYNHGYTAPLKALIDTFGEEWQAKPVAFVSYGGASGGLRAVEQLRLVFAELHATTVRDGVMFANAREAFDEAGEPRDAGRAGRAMAGMLSALEWWAAVLRHGRRVAPYAERNTRRAA